jgi:branched-chain amino acid transport system substrate-binding protein
LHRVSAVVAVGVLFAATACGSSKKSTSTTAGTSPATTAATATTAAGTATTAGGTSTTAGGPATGEPITLGLTNMEGGAISLPEVRNGVEAAIAYVNAHGGVQGRPFKLLRCDVDGSPEKSVDCGNKFVEGKVTAAIEGVDVGADAMLPILKSAGIPLIGHVPFGPQQRVFGNNAYFFGAAVPAYGAAELQTASDQGFHNAALFLADLPSSHSYEQTVLQPTGQRLGVKVKVIYYDPANPDWASIVNTALALSPDTVGSPAAQESDCIGFIKAARAAGYKGNIFGAACSAFIQVLGADAVGVQTYSDLWSPQVPDAAPAPKQAEMKTYTDAMTAAGYQSKIIGFAEGAFSDIVNLSKIMNGISGTIDSASVSSAVKAATNFDSFLGPTINCDGSAWKGETSCGNEVLIYEVIQGGGRKLVSNGFLQLGKYAPQ